MKAGETTLYVRAYDLTKWLIERGQRFPKNQRFVIGARLQTATLDLLDMVSLGLLQREDRPQRLRKADEALARIRIAVRLSRDLGVLSERQAEHAGREIAEVGRMLGGWRRRLSVSHAGP